MNAYALPLFGLIAACQPLAAAPAPSPDAVEMRVWELPAGQAGRLADSLQRVLYRNSESPPVGKATEGPGGTLVVVAPPKVLDGIDDMVKRAVAGMEAETQPSTVTMRYWFVEGVPADASSRDNELAVVSVALDQVIAVDGPQELSLRGTRTLHSVEGRLAAIKHTDLNVSQIVTVDGTQVIADVDVNAEGGGAIETRMVLEEGQVAVLAQTGLRGDNLYILVQPTID